MEHKVVNHRHAKNCQCTEFGPNVRIIVTCSCGWRQGCATRAQAKMIKANHEAHPTIPVVSSSQLMEVLDLRTLKFVAAEAKREVSRKDEPDLTNYFESLYS